MTKTNEERVEAALKPCPFCGGVRLKSGGDDKIVGTWCLDCDASGPNEYGSRATWNTRASLSAADAVKAEPVHVIHRRKVLSLAAAMDGADYAGDISAFDDSTVEGQARTHAIIAAAYDFEVNDDGNLIALVAGDMGWTRTGIRVSAPPTSELEALREELHLMKTAGIIEVAVRNPSVYDYMDHWEKRAETAEARLAELEKAEPVAWMRRWAFEGVDVMSMKPSERPRGWRFHEVTVPKVLSDDVPLYTAPPTSELEALRKERDTWRDNFSAMHQQTMTAEARLAEAMDADVLAITVAEITQGESSTPRCEPPGEYDVGISRRWTARVLKAIEYQRRVREGGKA